MNAFQNPGDLIRANKKDILSDEWINHIMLAVTEVNGCALCAYYHSKNALEMGLGQDDVDKLLNGQFEHLEKDETTALLFAQHYADQTGIYAKDAWQRVVDVYGEEKAKAILAAIRMIMFGNVYGISAGAIWGRIKGKKPENTNFWNDLAICLLVIIAIPFGLIRGLFIK